MISAGQPPAVGVALPSKKMTAELKEAVALTPWAPVKVKEEEEEDENVLASGQRVHAENIKVRTPGESPQPGFDVSEEEKKVNSGLGGES